MKKLFSILLTAVMLLSVVSLTGCTSKTLKLGLGVVSYIENVKSADADKNGQGELTSTAAAVLVDGKGKIVSCKIDSLDATLAFSSKGEFQKISNFQTKKEIGKDYGMVAYGGAKKEWFEQVDAFETLVIGKTLQDVKALVATEGKGNSDVVNAGCTIIISDFVTAIEKAINNATDTNAAKDDKLNLGIVATQTGSNAASDKTGTNEVETTISAVATNKDGKITESITDAYQASLSFDTKGVTSQSGKVDVTTKLQAGANYGMVAYGGASKEWFEQADIFDAKLIGKTSSEISELVTQEGNPNNDLVGAGCTIYVSDMVKAAIKAAK